MRRALLLSLIILLSQPFVSATDITADSEEDSSGTLSGTYTVSNGATWTVSGDYEIAENTAVVIEEGATMVVSGSMDAVAPPKLNLAGTANVHVPVGFIGETGVLRIDFADSVMVLIEEIWKGCVVMLTVIFSTSKSPFQSNWVPVQFVVDSLLISISIP